MKFSEFVHHDAVTSSLSASDRDGVIAELVDSLVAADALSADHRDSVVSATIAREELGTTGIGNGVAIPHAKHPAVDRVVAMVGVGESVTDDRPASFSCWFRLPTLPRTTCRPWRPFRGICRKTHSDNSCLRRKHPRRSTTY